MDLMWITPECPYPPNTGGRLGIWKRIEYLSRTNNIYLFSICDNIDESIQIELMLKYCKSVKLYPRNSKISSVLRSIINPFPAVSRWNEKLKIDLETDYKKINPDYVFVDSPQMLGACSDNILNSQRIILNQHNIEFLALNSLANELGVIRRFIYKIVARQMELYEKRLYKNISVKLYTFVSELDKNFFEKNYGLKNTYLVPVGTDFNFHKVLHDCHNIIFVAKMSYPANEAGAIWLIDEILPRIKEKVSDVRLYLVGKDPQERLIMASKQNDSVILTGTVDSLDRYYAKCNVAVVPIMTGGGVNVKLFEALGYGKLVVTTEKGIEGTKFNDRVQLRVANNACEFADACVDLLLNPLSEENVRLRERAHALLESQYSWSGICADFESKIKELQ